MNPIQKTLAVGALLITAIPALHAQYAPPPPTQPFPGFLNQELRAKDPYWSNWDLGGQFRSRYEVRENALIAPPFHDFKAVIPAAGVINGKGNDNSFLANKLLLRAGYTDKWWNTMIVGRSSFVSGDNRGAAPNINQGSSPDSDGPAELHQANFTIGNHKEFPVSIKVGRQELSYGDERLVGAFAWNNIGRVFDGVKVRWQHEAFVAEAFGTRLVVPDDNGFNLPSDYESFSGVHLTTKLVPKHTAELYFFSRNIGRANPRQFGGVAQAAGSSFSPAPFNFSGRDVYTVGTRWKSNPGDFGNWDYSAEYNFQFGNYINDRPDAGVAQTVGAGVQAGNPANGSATAPRLEHLAMAFSGMVGYTFADTYATPRLALEYNYASGDSNPTDGNHGTFDNLYPTNHKFYGYGDYMSWQNMHNLRLSLSAKPTLERRRGRPLVLARRHVGRLLQRRWDPARRDSRLPGHPQRRGRLSRRLWLQQLTWSGNQRGQRLCLEQGDHARSRLLALLRRQVSRAVTPEHWRSEGCRLVLRSGGSELLTDSNCPSCAGRLGPRLFVQAGH